MAAALCRSTTSKWRMAGVAVRTAGPRSHPGAVRLQAGAGLDPLNPLSCPERGNSVYFVLLVEAMPQRDVDTTADTSSIKKIN
jgi:hypothetical protein